MERGERKEQQAAFRTLGRLVGPETAPCKQTALQPEIPAEIYKERERGREEEAQLRERENTKLIILQRYNQN